MKFPWTKPKLSKLTIEDRLIEAKAKLARAKKLPNSAFTIPGNNLPYTMRHGIDEKPKRIAELEAEIAYLEVKQSSRANLKPEEKHE